MATGVRSGERCLEYFHSTLVPQSADLRGHHGSRLPCGPTRAQIHTALHGLPGNAYLNHGVSIDENAPVPNFKFAYENGGTVSWTDLLGNARNDFVGPHFYDLAAGLPVTHVPAASQPMWDGTAANYWGRRGLSDDVQAWTGWLGVWLARLGVKFGMYGKFTNGMRGADGVPPANGPRGTAPGMFAPPGVLDMAIQESDTAHWSSITHEYHATPTARNGVVGATTNAWNGIGKATTQTTFDYKNVPSKVAKINASTVEVTFTSNPRFKVGDLVTFDSMPDGTNNVGGGTNVGSGATLNGEHVVTLVPSGLKVQVSNAGAADVTVTSGFSAAGSAVYAVFECVKHADDAIDFLKTCADDDPICLYIAPRVTHIDPDSTYNKTSSIKYKGTVSASSAFKWPNPNGHSNGTGVSGPAGPNPGDSGYAGYQLEWAARQEMLADFDDMLRRLFGYLTTRWALETITLIVLADNGDQIGEWTSRGDGAVKIAGWEASLKSPCFIMSPEPTFASLRNQKVRNVQTSHSDIAPTVLDIFGWMLGDPNFTNHHTHTNRDGISIIRRIRDNYCQHRAIPWTGQMASGQSEGFYDEFGIKWSRGSQDFNFNTDELTDYETTKTIRDSTQQAAFNARANAILTCRWDPVTDSHPARTI